LVVSSQPGKRIGQAVAGGDRIGADLEGASEAHDRLLEATELQKSAAGVLVSLGVPGLRRGRAPRTLERLLRMACLEEHGTEMMVGFGNTRVEGNGTPVARRRLLQPSLARQRIAEIHVRGRVPRVRRSSHFRIEAATTLFVFLAAPAWTPVVSAGGALAPVTRFDGHRYRRPRSGILNCRGRGDRRTDAPNQSQVQP
jgi:hypothetical protein